MTRRKTPARPAARTPRLVPALRAALKTADRALEEIGHAPKAARKTRKKAGPAKKRR